MPDLSPAGAAAGPEPDLLTPRRRLRPALLATALLAAVVAIVCLIPRDRVIGGPETDMTNQFLAWRAYGAQTLRLGHLPLWNPYTYAGQPFLGGFQSALLYPPNVIFLFLPLTRAVNLSLLLHLVILGWGMYRLASRRGLHPAAALVCAGLFPLSGVVFPHLYAGHLPNLCSMAWTPWIFAGLEDFYRAERLQGLLLASAAAALQILAGHVQYVFYTAIAAGLQAVVYSLAQPAIRRRALPALAAIYVAAALLSAGQLFPGLTGIRQGIRHVKLGFSFARMFSFPLENLLTFIAPGFFGDLQHHLYWGRGYLWEMSVFVGVSGLILAGTALLDPERKRATRFDLGLTLALLILAAGSHTPLFGFLYNYVPGFDRFRGVSKFTFPAVMFLILAIGRGADALIRGRLPSRSLAANSLQAGVCLGLAGLVLKTYPALLGGFLTLVRDTQESYLPAPKFTDRAFIHAAGVHAGWSLVLAGAILGAIGVSLLGAQRRPCLRWVPLALLPLEMIGFARTHFALTNATTHVLPAGLRQYVADHPGDYRVLDPQALNNGYFLGVPDIWGDDPGPLSRYAEFITYTQGGDPNHISQNITFHGFPALYTMLRFRYAFVPSLTGIAVAEQVVPPMARAQLISDYRVIPQRDALFAAMTRPSFNPRQTVLLETVPYPRPMPDPDPGTVRVTDITPDSLTLEADVKSSTLLLITDLYSANWHARSLDGSVQKLYDVLPANYVLRAIPLAPGHHHLIVEYLPGGFRLGLGVSLFACLLWAGLALRLRRTPAPTA